MKEPKIFSYRIYLVKEVRLKSYSVPPFYKNIREAELDIEMAIRDLKIREQLKEGVSEVKFQATYLPQPEGFYTPVFSKPEVTHIKEDVLITPIRYKTSFWGWVKKLFSRMKVKRG